MYVRSSAESTKTTLVIFGLSGGVQMAVKTNPSQKVQCQLGQGIREMWGVADSSFPGQSSLLCCYLPVGLACLRPMSCEIVQNYAPHDLFEGSLF